jgi:hypothetical protein
MPYASSLSLTPTPISHYAPDANGEKKIRLEHYFFPCMKYCDGNSALSCAATGYKETPGNSGESPIPSKSLSLTQ